jgi:hypothetical protein
MRARHLQLCTAHRQLARNAVALGKGLHQPLDRRVPDPGRRASAGASPTQCDASPPLSCPTTFPSWPVSPVSRLRRFFSCTTQHPFATRSAIVPAHRGARGRCGFFPALSLRALPRRARAARLSSARSASSTRTRSETSRRITV